MAIKGEDSLKYAEQLLQEGKVLEARAVLVEYVQHNPSSERGWWQLSFTLTDPKQQIDCMERVLRIDPNSTLAQSRMDTLKESMAHSEPVPPLDAPISFEASEIISTPPARQASVPVQTQKTLPIKAIKKTSWQYAILAVVACAFLGMCGAVAVMFYLNYLPK